MTDSGARREMAPLESVETAIAREAQAIAQRFPDTDIAVVEQAVRDVFAELRAEAEVETHLLALTRHRVYDRLQEQGHAFQPAASDKTESDSDAGSDAGVRAERG
jgi:hypothetical protein